MSHKASRGFTRARYLSPCFFPDRVASLGLAKWSPGSFWFARFHTDVLNGRCVNWGSSGLTRECVRVTEFILVRVRVGSFLSAKR